jgi:hypothetical protein
MTRDSDSLEAEAADAAGDDLEVEAAAETSYDAAMDSSSSDVEPSQYARVEAKFTLSPRAVAVAASVFGIGCLAALAIVADVKKADGLSTIALALAILAFVIQILVFVVQGHTSSQQMLQSEQLNTQTRALLAEMQTTARATQTMVGQQFSQLLRAFMDAAKTADPKEGFDQEAFERRLLANIRREQVEQQIGAQAARPPATARSPSTISTAQRRAALDRARARRRSTTRRYDAGPFPPEVEARPVLPDLQELSPAAKRRLQSYGADKHDERPNDYEGYPLSPEYRAVEEPLVDRGLIQMLRLPPSEGGPDDGLVYRLTDKGDLAARILNASGTIPAWATAIFASSPQEP